MFFSLLFIERSLVEDRQVPLDATSNLPTLFDGTTRFIFLLICLSFEKICFMRSLWIGLTFRLLNTKKMETIKVVHKLYLPICTTCLDYKKPQGACFFLFFFFFLICYFCCIWLIWKFLKHDCLIFFFWYWGYRVCKRISNWFL